MFNSLNETIEREVAGTIFRMAPVAPRTMPSAEELQTDLTEAAEKASVVAPDETGQPTKVSANQPAKSQKIGRNDPCPCGSGKKYKKCGLLDTAEHQTRMKDNT